MADIFVLTTSHGQINQLDRLVTSLSRFIYEYSHFRIRFLVVESALPTDAYEHLKQTYQSSFCSFEILSAPVSSFWTSSVFQGLQHIQSHINRSESLRSSRVILINSDVLPSSWSFLCTPISELETLVTLSPEKIVQRSGFSLPFHLIAYHYYPFLGKPCPSHSWTCLSVPARLILFPASAVNCILNFSSVKKFLPHYSSDFVLTGLLSRKLSLSWRVRVDNYIQEDISTTGIKNFYSLNFASIRSYLFTRKSSFNLIDAFFFPLFFSFSSLPLYLFIPYVISSWLKYIFKVSMWILFNSLVSLRKSILS